MPKIKKKIKKAALPIPEYKPMEYEVILNIIGGPEYRYEADTLFEAFGLMKPAIVKGKAILTVKKGLLLKTERVLHPFELKRLLVSKLYKQLMEKRLNLLLK